MFDFSIQFLQFYILYFSRVKWRKITLLKAKINCFGTRGFFSIPFTEWKLYYFPLIAGIVARSSNDCSYMCIRIKKVVVIARYSASWFEIMHRGNSQPLSLIKGGISREQGERTGNFFSKTLLTEPVSDTVRAEDLQSGSRAKANKETEGTRSREETFLITRGHFATTSACSSRRVRSAWQKRTEQRGPPSRNSLLCAFTISSIFPLWKLAAFARDGAKNRTKSVRSLFCSGGKGGEKKRKEKNGQRVPERKSNNRWLDRYPFRRSLLSCRAFLTDSFITARSKTRNERSPWNKSRIFQANEKPAATIRAC